MTKQDYKNKVLQDFTEIIKSNLWGYCCKDCQGSGGNGVLGEGFRKCAECYGTGIVDWQTEPLKSFLSQSLDEIVELAFRECEQNKIEDVDEAWNLLCKLDANHKGLEEGSMILVNHCIDKRSKLENVFLGKMSRLNKSF